MEINEFKIRSYGWQELGMLYGPDLTKQSAGKRLTAWVNKNSVLLNALMDKGWAKGAKILTPVQVEVIVQYLGEP